MASAQLVGVDSVALDDEERCRESAALIRSSSGDRVRPSHAAVNRCWLGSKHGLLSLSRPSGHAPRRRAHCSVGREPALSRRSPGLPHSDGDPELERNPNVTLASLAVDIAVITDIATQRTEGVPRRALLPYPSQLSRTHRTRTMLGRGACAAGSRLPICPDQLWRTPQIDSSQDGATCGHRHVSRAVARGCMYAPKPRHTPT